MNKLLLQQITFFSSIVGLFLAIVTLIPFIGQIGFFLLICFSATFVILFMMKHHLIVFFEIKESVIVGALIGAISYIAFSILYIPVVIILMKVFGLYTNYGVSLMLSGSGFWMLVVLTVFMAIFSATINAFFAFLTYYVTGILKSINSKKVKTEDDEFRL